MPTLTTKKLIKTIMEDVQTYNIQFHDFIESMESLHITSHQLFEQEFNYLDINNNISMDLEQQSCDKSSSAKALTCEISPHIEPIRSFQEDENDLSKKRVFNPPLSLQRYTFIMNLLNSETGVQSVTDLGSGNCRLMTLLKSLTHLRSCNFVELNDNVLEFEAHHNAQPLAWDILFGRSGTLHELKVNLYHGDLTIPDSRLLNCDAMTLVEVIEHLNFDVLQRLPYTVFGIYKPKIVVITTPNREFNTLFFGEDRTKLRHWDHKFEWTRAEFQSWCYDIISAYPEYSFELTGVGHLLPASQELGPCTQIAVFHKSEPQLAKDIIGTDSSNISETLALHNSYIYPGQKVEPENHNLDPIDWSQAN